MQPVPIHWSYFLSLEQDLATASRYVEFCTDNFATHSTEFTRLLLAACSEVDVVAKLVCRKIAPSSNAKDINAYQREILSRSPSFHGVEVLVPAHALRLFPWRSWGSGTNPTWWTEHNGVKHERDQYFKSANLENTLNATAGLFALLMYIFGIHLACPPRLFRVGSG
jgi:hypothetical protein